MATAYSRLKRMLETNKLSVPELHRQIERRGVHVNVKSLYRLADEHRPLERLDLRVAGAICQVCNVPISELITFQTNRPKLRRFSAAKHRRLEALMTKNNDGALSSPEAEELRTLVREAEEMTVENARSLAGHRRRLAGRRG